MPKLRDRMLFPLLSDIFITHATIYCLKLKWKSTSINLYNKCLFEDVVVGLSYKIGKQQNPFGLMDMGKYNKLLHFPKN